MKTSKVLDDEPGFDPAELRQATDEVSAPTHDEIARLAYSYWEARGYYGGSPWDDWLRAEEELQRRQEL